MKIVKLKKKNEELQGFLHFKGRGFVLPNKKQYNRKKKHKKLREEE